MCAHEWRECFTTNDLKRSNAVGETSLRRVLYKTSFKSVFSNLKNATVSDSMKETSIHMRRRRHGWLAVVSGVYTVGHTHAQTRDNPPYLYSASISSPGRIDVASWGVLILSKSRFRSNTMFSERPKLNITSGGFRGAQQAPPPP